METRMITALYERLSRDDELDGEMLGSDEADISDMMSGDLFGSDDEDDEIL